MKSIVYLLMPFFMLAACQSPKPESSDENSSQEALDYALVIHGGAGTIRKDLMTPEKEASYRESLQAALDAGEAILKAGGSSMDAVQAAINVMEDSPNFNAGKGAVFTNAETVELDASFMDGQTLNAGAVAGVKTVKNPINLARLVMDSSVHVMMAGVGADQYAQDMGLEIVENEYFFTPRRLEQVRKRKGTDEVKLDHDSDEAVTKKHGTVGAAALDKQGNLAAGTSTGGMTNKRWGRVGDAPIIGAGTYANNEACAVSCTGHGEYFIRNVVAYDVAARMLYKGESLQTSADYVVNQKLKAQQGEGGLIAVDKYGNFSMPFNTPGMFRGVVTSAGETFISIYEDEP